LTVRRSIAKALSLSLLTAALARTAPPAEPPPDLEAQLASLRAQISRRDYAAAEKGARELLARVEGTSGPDSPDAARAIDPVVEALWRGEKTRDADALSLAERAVAILENLPDAELDLARALHTLGNVRDARSERPQARAAYERALAIRERLLPPDDGDLLATLNNLGLEVSKLGDKASARPLLEQALAIRERTLPPDDPKISNSLRSLGGLLQDLGDYEAARPLLERAVAIRRATLGPAHHDVGVALNSLAVLRYLSGDYAGAERDYLEAVRILEISDPVGALLPLVRANYAVILEDRGDAAGAMRQFDATWRAIEASKGPDDPVLALALDDAGQMAYAMGDYADSRPLLERAVQIWEERPESDKERRALGYENLANLRWRSGDPAGAEALHRQALALREQTIGADHPLAARSLTNLGVLAGERGDWQQARQLEERALAILRKTLEADHPDLIVPLTSLGTTLAVLGEAQQALSSLQEALALARKNLGAESPQIPVILGHLAAVNRQLGDHPAALAAALDAAEISRRQIRLVGQALAERQVLRLAALQSGRTDLALSIALDGGEPAELAQAFDAVVRTRALVFDAMAVRQRASLDQTDPATAGLRQVLADARERLAHLTLRRPADMTTQVYLGKLDEARRTKEGAERALAERSSTFRDEQSRSEVGLAEVARSLPEGTALVAFVHLARVPAPVPASASRGPAAAVPSYLALVLPPGSVEPRALLLGTDTAVAPLVERWRREASTPPSPIPELARAAEERCRVAGDALRRVVWDPVARAAGDARRILVVPDGALSFVNFSALPARRGGYLAEHGPTIHLLVAERDAVERTWEADGGGLLAVGGPDFEAVAAAPTVGEAVRPGTPEPELRAPKSNPCLRGDGLRFDPLPLARTEAEDVAGAWSDRGSVSDLAVLIGAAATEGMVKATLPGHRLVHFATHGFLFPDRCDLPSSAAAATVTPWDSETLPPAVAESPLLRSGLALAGANRPADPGTGEDGLLTAEEISSLDLRATDWVVLSACDTGLGEQQAWEGILGLRRAFQTAGARTVVTSLWQVQDDAARGWMRRLYEARLSGAATDAAVRAAQVGTLEALRRAGRSTHPFTWGAFVAAGDWR
jgi:CHAT domain-containing protein/tetratricopeptide (TPR) repeat protein